MVHKFRLNDLWITCFVVFFNLAMLVADVLEDTGQAEPARPPLGQFGTQVFSLYELFSFKI